MNEVQVWVLVALLFLVLAIVQFVRSRKGDSLRKRIRRLLGQLFDIVSG